MNTQAMFGAAAALVLGVSQACAATIGPSSSGIASPDQIVGFDEVALTNGTAVTNQYAAFGVTFSPQVTFLSGVSPRQGFAGPAALNFEGNPPNAFDPFSILFTQTVDAASFAFTRGGASLFEALLGGAVVESFSASTELNTTNIFGFTGIVFDEIRVTAQGFDRTGALDTVAFSVAPIPLPASALLLLGGLAGFAATRRRTGQGTKA